MLKSSKLVFLLRKAAQNILSPFLTEKIKDLGLLRLDYNFSP